MQKFLYRNFQSVIYLFFVYFKFVTKFLSFSSFIEWQYAFLVRDSPGKSERLSNLNGYKID